MSKSKLEAIFSKFKDNHPVLSTAASIGGVGAGAAALVGLIRDLRTAMDERKKKEELAGGGIDPETIVLRVKKRAEDESLNCVGGCEGGCADPEVCKAQESTHDKVVKQESTVQRETPVGSHATSGTQRDFHGKWTDAGVKSASTGFLTRTAQILAGAGAGAAGYYVVQKIHDKLEQNRLKKQIEAAQQEYLSLIDGSGVKKAEAVNKLFLIGDPMFYGPLEKDAGIIHSIYDALGNQSKNVTAAMLASYIMAGLGAGYITKRVLHNKFDEAEPEEEPTKVRRILFKTEQDDGEKAASAESETFEIDPGAALASIGIMMDCMKDSDDPMSKRAYDYSFLKTITKTPEGRQWLLDVYARGNLGLPRDVDSSEIPNMGMMDKLTHARTLRGIRKNPEKHMPAIRGYVMNLMRSNPKEWYGALANPRNADIVSGMANRTLADSLSAGEFGQWANLPGIRHLIKGLGHVYFGSNFGRENVINKLVGGNPYKPVQPIGPMGKAGSDLTSLSSMLSRMSILTDKRNTDLDSKLDKVLENMPTKRRKKKPSETEVHSEGEGADEYVLENGKQIAKILNAMKEKGLVA